MTDPLEPVVVDRSSLKLWGMAHSGHLVHLSGRTGAWWCECFRRVEASSPGAWRFYLDEPRAVVAFSSAPALTERALARLEELVSAANARAAQHVGVGADARATRSSAKA
jgi:hypothetical protein